MVYPQVVRRLGYLMLPVLLAAGILTLIVQSAHADGKLQDVTFPPPLSTPLTGTYGTVADGIGMQYVTSTRTITLTVPGTVTVAYIYWSVRDLNTGGDNAITLVVDGGAGIPVTADATFGPDLAFNTQYNYVYVAEITSLVQNGTHTYRIDDLTISSPSGRIYGAGIIAVYEDPSLPTTTIQMKQGLDYLYHGFPGVRGSPSEVNCLFFAANATFDRVMDVTMFVADVGANRPNRLWYEVGTGITPTNLLTSSGAISVTNPFFNSDGEEWDTYESSLVVPSGSTWVCFQVESVVPGPGDPDGASVLWLMSATGLREQTPTTVSLAVLQAAEVPLSRLIWPLLIVLAGLITTGLLLYRRRRPV